MEEAFESLNGPSSSFHKLDSQDGVVSRFGAVGWVFQGEKSVMKNDVVLVTVCFKDEWSFEVHIVTVEFQLLGGESVEVGSRHGNKGKDQRGQKGTEWGRL